MNFLKYSMVPIAAILAGAITWFSGIWYSGAIAMIGFSFIFSFWRPFGFVSGTAAGSLFFGASILYLNIMNQGILLAKISSMFKDIPGPQIIGVSILFGSFLWGLGAMVGGNLRPANVVSQK
jgi:hypothetical protein